MTSLRTFMAIPYVLLGRLLMMLQRPESQWAFDRAWRISGDGEHAWLALLATIRFAGAEVAMARAAEWLETAPRPEIAAVAGDLALDAGQSAMAQYYLDRGRELGDEPRGTLDRLAFRIGLEHADKDGCRVAEEFMERDDLPADLSRMAREEVLWQCMLHQDFDRAAVLADELLAVEDVPAAEIAWWAMALRRGDDAAAARHLRRAKWDEPRRLYFQCLGLASIGRVAEAADLLDRLRETDRPLALTLAASLQDRGVNL